MASTDTSRGTALITGASSGIGAVYAHKLAKRGYDLILVARNMDRLNSTASRITQESDRRVSVLRADLASREGQLAVERLLHADQHVTLLLNNAGVGATQPLVHSDVQRLDEMIQLNVTSVMRLARAAAPAFTARGRGAIINMASAAALAPELLNGVYAASKAFVLAFTQSLHHELAHHGVQVQAVLPGATNTHFWSLAGIPASDLPSHIVMDVEELVDAALVGFDRHELITIPSLPTEEEWERFDEARKALGPRLSRSSAALRYRT